MVRPCLPSMCFVTMRVIPNPSFGERMMPRGEVGLIFAGIGAQLVLGSLPVVDAGTYAAAVFMVVATTYATPPLLLWSMRRTSGRTRVKTVKP